MHTSHFLQRVLNKFHLLHTINSVAAIRINKKKFIIPLLGDQGYDNLDLSEPWMTELLLVLRPHLKGGFVDVGVNLGQTLLKVQAVVEDLNYVGFEPNPTCVNYVQELIRLNAFKNTVLLPVAIGGKTEMLRLNFFTEDKSDSSATLIENFKNNAGNERFIFVPVFECSQVLSFLPRRPQVVLKIDVEGAEMEVLPVYTEDNRSRLERQDQIEVLLQSWHYNIARIRKKGRVGLEWIDRIGIHSNIEDCDYLLCHDSLNEEISSCF